MPQTQFLGKVRFLCEKTVFSPIIAEKTVFPAKTHKNVVSGLSRYVVLLCMYLMPKKSPHSDLGWCCAYSLISMSANVSYTGACKSWLSALHIHYIYIYTLHITCICTLMNIYLKQITWNLPNAHMGTSVCACFRLCVLSGPRRRSATKYIKIS